MSGNSRYNKLTKSTRHQTAVIYDAVSEGPIEGLVNGPNSIIIDGNPAASANVSTYFQLLRTPNASYNSTSGIVIDQGGGAVFENLTTAQGERYISVIAGKKRATNASTAAGNNIVSTATSFFVAGDIRDEGKPLNQFIRIAGAGKDGTEYVGQITQFINVTHVRVDSPPAKTVSSANVSIDLVDTIATIDSDTQATLTNGGGVTTSATAVLISPPKSAQGDVLKYNFNNFGWAFRKGEREQGYLGAPSGIGSASSAHSINQALDQTDLRSIGQPTNTALGINTEISPDRNGETGISRVASTGMNIADPGEIDFIRVTLNHASMISQKENGKKGPGFAEYRIVFSYKTDSTDSFSNNEHVIYGRRTLSSNVRDYHANTRVRSGSSGIIDGKIQAPFNSIFSFDISKYQPFTDYKIEIQRVSPVNQKENSWQQTNQGTLVSIENIITDKLTYPYTAYAAVVVDAEDFDDIPERAYEIRGLKVKVPTNYFPADEIHDDTGARRATASYSRNVTTGADTGNAVDWDGNFRGDQKTFNATSPNYMPVYTSNPVWIFMDLITNPRYGLGKYVDPDFDFTQVDKYTLYNLAKYCDELVPNGKGGTEPRFSCNLFIQKGQDALRLLKDLSTMIRGMLIWHNGQVSLNSNREKGPIYTFGKSNVIEGTFSYSGSSRRFRTNEVKVTWNDPDNRYKQAVEIVTDDNNIAETGRVITKDLPALGCTSQGQAQRLGRWHLLTEKLEKEIVTFSTGINGGALVAGDVILVQDADDKDVQFSGRVSTAKASTTTVIETDRALSLNGTDNFDLHLIYPSGGAYIAQPTATINSTDYKVGDLILEHANGTAISTQASASQLKDDSGGQVQVIWSEDQRIETKPISSYNSSNVTVSSAFSSAPNSEVIYAITGQQATGADVTGSAKEYIITSIKEKTKELQFEITAAEYDVNKFTEIDRGWVIPDIPDIMRPPLRTEIVPVPINVSVQIVPDEEGGDVTDVNQPIRSYKALVQWTAPKSIRTDSDGNALDDIYEHLAGFDLEHDVPQSDKVKNNNGFIREEVRSRGQSSFSIRNIPPGDEYRVRVRTVNTQGYTSEFIQTKFAFDPSDIGAPSDGVIGAGLNQQIARGGSLTTGMSIGSANATVTFDSSTYTFTPPTGVPSITIESGNTNFTQQNFSSLADGETGYLLFDYDGNLARGNTRTDVLRSVVAGTDNVAATATGGQPYYFTFFKRLGQSNEDLSQANGTFSLDRFSSNVVGSSTTFLNDFQAGDIVVLDDAGVSRFWAKVAHIKSNTSMTVASGSDRTYSGANLFAQSLRFDRQKDTIIASVKNTGGTFSLVNFASGEKGADGLPGADGEDGSAGVDSRTVNLTVGDQAFTYANTGSTPSPSSTTVTATALNTDGTVYYEFFLNDVSQANTTTNTYTYTPQSSFSNMPDKVEVQIRDAGSASIKARDQITMYGVKPGTDGTDGDDGANAITVILSNEAHTLPTTNQGSVNYQDSGTDIVVYDGTTQVPYDGSSPYASPSFRVSASGTSIGVGTASTVSTYTRRFGVHNSMTANNAKVTYTITVKNSDGNEFTFTKIQSLSKSIGGDDGTPGVDAYTVTFDNESHAFDANSSGTISDFTTFSSSPKVYKGSQLYSYDASSPYAANSFRYGTRTDTNVSSAVSASGVVSLNSNSAIGSGSTLTGNVTIPIIDNSDGVTVAVKTLNFVKVNAGSIGVDGVRGSSIFTFEESDTSQISAAQASNFAGTLNNASAQAVASAVIANASDSTIRPNDRITVTDNSADVAGTRIYNGSAATSSGSITAANFSSLVVETFDGSVIVEGTLQANRLSANTTFTNRANIANTIQLGTSGDNGKFVTANKTTFADGDLGVYFDGAGNVNIGQDSGNKFIKFYSANGTLAIGQSVQIGATAASVIESGAATGANSTTLAAANTAANTNILSNGAKTGGTVGGWTIDSSAIYSGTKDTSGYTTGGITLNSGGSIHAKQFYIDTSGNAFFKGSLTIGSVTDAGGATSDSVNSAANAASDAQNTADTKATLAQANTAANTNILSNGAKTGGFVGGWTIDSTAIYSGTKDTSGYTTGGITLNSGGSIHAKQFYIDTSGNAFFKGSITIGSITGAGGATSDSVNSAANSASDAANAASDAQNTADTKTTLAAANTAANTNTLSNGNKTGGQVGGWTITPTAISGNTPTVYANNFTNQGIELNSAGSIHSKEFFIDSSGNAEFKGTIAGNNVTISGTLTTSNITLASTGANVSGTTIGTFYENDMNYRYLGDVGTGAGYYVGNILVSGVGGTAHVKTLHFHVSDGSNLHTNSTTTVTFATQQESGPFSARLCRNIDHAIHESRVFPPVTGTNGTGGTSTNPDFASRTQGMIPVSFKYEGTSTINLYVAAQGDNNSAKLGFIKYNFVKFGTTDPIFSFSNLTGQSLSTTLYANTQVTGGFQGTKTVSISGGSAQFKIDNGSFGTSSQQISNGSYVNVQMTTASTNLATTSTTVTIGGVGRGWSLTTGGTGGGSGGSGGSGGGGGGCLVYGSNIIMADGTSKKVQDIVVGDSLEAITDTTLDESNEDAYKTWTAPSLVNTTKTTSTVETVNVDSYSWYYILNEKVHATYEHPFLILRGDTYSWERADDILEGDFLVTNNLVLEKVWRKQRVDQEVQTYNFNVEDADTYIVENIVTHNAGEIKA